MAEKKPQVRISRAKLYKMVSYKGKDGGVKNYTPLTAASQLPKIENDIGGGFKSLISGVNSLGATLNSISLAMENMTNILKTNVMNDIEQQAKIEAAKKKTERDLEKLRKSEEKEKARKEKKAQRDESEDDSEKEQGALAKITGKFAEGARKAVGGLFGTLAKLAKTFLGYAIGFAVLDWLSKNPDKIKRLAETLYAIGKFVFKVSSFLVGSAFDGLIKFLENPVSLQGLFGVVQFLLSAAPIFLGIAALKNPMLVIKGVSWLVKTLAGGLLNIGKLGGAAKGFRTFTKGGLGLATGALGAAGLAAFGASMDEGADAYSVGGAAAGAAGGQLLGATLGAATGIPGMGMIGGFAGGAAGAAIGKSIGPMLKPIVEPIKRFFNKIGEVAAAILAPIKDTFEDFFVALGAFMNGMLDAIEPHLPMIKKILSFGVNLAFLPLLTGIKALTAVMKFFAGDAEKSVSDLEGKAKGGFVQPQGAAGGGWISGPMSGYPVSLDGGKSAAFIGHGTEWVGTKGFAKGGAFVVPFNTPATKQNPRLTSMRMKEASRGGYAMPSIKYNFGGNNTTSSIKYNFGGAVMNTTIPKFAEGGKFDPKEYAKDAKTTTGLTLNNKTYYVVYDPKEDGTVTVKHMTKRLKAGLFGMGEETIPVEPGSDEFKAVIDSKGLKDYIGKAHQTKRGTGRSSKIVPYKIKEVKLDPMIKEKFYHHKSYQQNLKAWEEKGVTGKQGEALAARAAAEYSLESADGKASVTKGMADPNAAPADLADIDVPVPAETVSETQKEAEKKTGGDKSSDKSNDKSGSGPDANTIDGALELLKKGLTKFTSTVVEANNPNAKAGSKLEEGKQSQTERRSQQQTATIVNNTQQAAPEVNSGGGEDQPFIIPNTSITGLDSDDYMKPRFGLVAEFNNDVVDFM